MVFQSVRQRRLLVAFVPNIIGDVVLFYEVVLGVVPLRRSQMCSANSIRNFGSVSLQDNCASGRGSSDQGDAVFVCIQVVNLECEHKRRVHR